MTLMGLLNISQARRKRTRDEFDLSGRRECSKKSVQSCPEPPEGKAAVLLAASRRARPLLTRGAYTLYVSTAKGRERRWRLFQHSFNLKSIRRKPVGLVIAHTWRRNPLGYDE